MMKNAEPLGDGRFRFSGSPEATRAFRSLPGFGLASTVLNYGKSSPQLLREIGPIAEPAGKSTVVVLCDGKPAALGTVVRKDGFIATKASEMHGKLSCSVAGRELPATIVKTNAENDLALLKVAATDLVPVVWADGNSPVPGSWLITPSAENDALGLGVVSIAARTIPDAPKMLLRNRAIVGVLIDQEAKNALVHDVTPDLPAAKAGLKPGDVIDKIDGQAMKGPLSVNQFLGKYKPGDKITMEITRAGKPMKLSAELVSSEKLAPKTSGEQLTRLSEAGGTVSKRHGSFASAFTHDTVLQATDCGGPVVNLDGQVVGLNIARADRTATYAIPAATLRKALERDVAEIKVLVPTLYRLVPTLRVGTSWGTLCVPSAAPQSGCSVCAYARSVDTSALLRAALVPLQRTAHGVDERRHAAGGGEHAADNDRPRVKAADEVEAEVFGRVADHHRVGERAAHEVFGELHLLVEFGDGAGGGGEGGGSWKVSWTESWTVLNSGCPAGNSPPFSPDVSPVSAPPTGPPLGRGMRNRDEAE